MKKLFYVKKLPTILLESAFIFLAVFLSFLADDFREDSNIREFERESLSGIYEDLKMDSIQFLRSAGVFGQIENKGIKLLAGVDKNSIEIDSAEIYFAGLLLGENIVPNKSHYQALKNAGLIQEIENINLRNSLTRYYEQDLVWAATFSESYQKRHFQFVDDIKPFVSIRKGQWPHLYNIRILDEEYFENDEVWKNSLGESLGLLTVRKGTLQTLVNETGELRKLIREEIEG